MRTLRSELQHIQIEFVDEKIVMNEICFRVQLLKIGSIIAKAATNPLNVHHLTGLKTEYLWIMSIYKALTANSIGANIPALRLQVLARIGTIVESISEETAPKYMTPVRHRQPQFAK
jgi:hypothetical protein